MIPIQIQNQDRNISARDYEDKPGQLRVTTWFRTLQGEGTRAGQPAVFLRLAGCNYGSKTDHCKFCDTSFQFDSATILDVDTTLNLLMAVEGYSPSDILVITGGEPTLQVSILTLIAKVLLGNLFKAVQIETNGTQPKFFEVAEAMNLVGNERLEVIVSPKANERLKKYPQVHSKVTWWAHALKFVISADPESAHHEVPDWALRCNHKIVMVSPMTVYKKPYEGEVSSIWDDELVDQEQTAANYRYAAAYALKHNLRLSIQMHTITAIA